MNYKSLADQQTRNELENLIKEKYGSLYAFSKALGVSSSCGHFWVRGKRSISPMYLKKICEILDNKITPKELRPDCEF